MDTRTLEALKASIEKWERNAEVANTEHASIGPKNCPLCLMFNTLEHTPIGDECDGCPVPNRWCQDTPYDEAYRAFFAGDVLRFRTAARAEVDFLKSLLPKEGE